MVDKKEYESYVMFLLNMLMKTKESLFYKHEYKKNFLVIVNQNSNPELKNLFMFNNNCSVQWY